jgi:hypothetical protein
VGCYFFFFLAVVCRLLFDLLARGVEVRGVDFRGVLIDLPVLLRLG